MALAWTSASWAVSWDTRYDSDTWNKDPYSVLRKTGAWRHLPGVSCSYCLLLCSITADLWLERWGESHVFLIKLIRVFNCGNLCPFRKFLAQLLAFLHFCQIPSTFPVYKYGLKNEASLKTWRLFLSQDPADFRWSISECKLKIYAVKHALFWSFQFVSCTYGSM